MDTKDLKRLADPFPASDIEWKPITISKKTSKGLAAAYVTNRAVMQRLDEICEPANWRNEFAPGPDGGVLCGISINVTPQADTPTWVTKYDAAENSDIEPVKGGISNSMRRAAVQWGIGRYLYDLPAQWLPVDQRGRFKKTPSLPAEFLPEDADEATSRRNSRPPAASRRSRAKASDARQHGEKDAEAEAPQMPADRPPAERTDDWYDSKLEQIRERLLGAEDQNVDELASSVEAYVEDWPQVYQQRATVLIKTRRQLAELSRAA